jgi:sugar lactone lactonase YvrE
LSEWQSLEGNLAANKKLESAQYIGHKALRGPETIVFTNDGTMYTGLMNGQIVRITKTGNIEKVAQIGEETNETLCNDYGPNLHTNPRCGRPLGLRLVDKTLYVADGFYGIFSVDITTGAKKKIISATDKRFGDKKLKIVNDLDLDGDVIYFIDSSHVRNVNQAIEETIAASASGRLFSYNTKTDKLELLLDNLYFPNGLQLMPDKQALLINECSIARILKLPFYLK